MSAVAKIHRFFSTDSLDTLALSVEEINHLIRSSKSLNALKLDYHLDMQDTLIIARNSLPVSHLDGILSFLSKFLGVTGFLNSEMRAYPFLDKGIVTLVPVSATMNGIEAPVSVINRKGGIAISEWIEDQDFYHQVLSHLAAVKVRQGSLLIIKH